MKVLILHQHFNTPRRGGPLRSYYLAKALADQNIRPVIITTHNKGSYQVDFIEGLEVHYLPVPYDNSYGFYKRVWSFTNYLARSVFISRKFRDAALCYAMSVPLTVGLAAMTIRRLFGVPFVFEVGDLWPQAPVDLGFIRNGVLKRTLFGLEKRIYRTAAKVVALSEPIREYIQSKTPLSVDLLPNMADTEFFQPAVKDAALEARYGVAGKFVISYIGAAGYANGLTFLLDCAKAAREQSLAVHFLVCAKGAMLDTLRNEASAASLQNVAFLPFQNREQIKEVLSVTDCNFICYRPEPVLETGSPNKYFDGLAAGKMTVINFGGWIKDEIESQRCGVSVRSPQEFVEKIRPFVSDHTLLQAYQDNGRRQAEEHYSRQMLSRKFVDIISGVLK